MTNPKACRRCGQPVPRRVTDTKQQYERRKCCSDSCAKSLNGRGRQRGMSPREAVYARCEIDPTTGCWNWTGTKVRGRGMVNYHGARVVAARFSYEAFVGPIPDGLSACHHCDNGACVNPAHLFLGTHAENMADMARKGRAAKPSARMTADTAAEVRRSPETQRTLAIRYGVTESAIYKIKRGITWRTAQ